MMTLYRRASLLLVTLVLAGASGRPTPDSGKTPTQIELPRVSGQGPRIPFVANAGQIDESVRFYAPTLGGTAFVTSAGEIVYGLPRTGNGESVRVTERMLGSRHAIVEGGEEGVTRVSYLVGNDTSRHRSNLKTYDTVSLGRIYDGIEVTLSARANTVEKVFHVDPGASVSDIRVGLEGISSLAVSAAGELEGQTDLGPVSFSRPIAFQELDGRRQFVDVAYTLEPGGYGFAIGDYDRSRPLVIDPVLASTYLGGNGNDYATQSVFAANRAIYVSGSTQSTNFPGAGTDKVGDDIYVARLNADLTQLEAAVYLGGNANDAAGGLAVDASGNVFVLGLTSSTDIPVTGGYDTALSPGQDIFVVRLDANLTAVSAGTYLGGSQLEVGQSLRVDASGNVFVVANTNSADYPVTMGTYDTTYNDTVSGNTDDVVISKLSNDLSTLMGSTYIGGGLWDVPYNSAFDAAGNIIIVGRTSSGTNFWGAPFPTTAGAYAGDYTDGWGAYGAYYDGFIAKLNNSLTSLVASTYLGSTSQYDVLWDVASAADGSIYVVGSTMSGGFPTTGGAYDTSFNNAAEAGITDGFVTHLDAGLTSVLQSTFIGAPASDHTIGIALDSAGTVHVGGYTGSSGFPTTAGAMQTLYGGGTADAVYLTMDPTLSTLQYSTFFGGTLFDVVYRPRINPAAGVYLHGYTNSADFPTSAGAYATSHGGGTSDAVVVRVPAADVAMGVEASAATVTVGQSIIYTLTLTNNGPGAAAGLSITDVLPAGVALVSATPSQGPACTGTTTVTCAVGDVAALANATVSIVVTATAPGTAANTAAVANAFFDAVTVNNQASVNVEILPDADGDGVTDATDNCPFRINPGQEDADGDGIGNVCEAAAIDLDGDGNGDVFLYDAATGDWSRQISQPAGGFVEESQGSWAAGWSVSPASFNDDQLTDFFLFNSTTGEWARMLTEPTGFTTEASGQWWPGWQRQVMELDGDGVSDLFLYDPATGVWFKCFSTVSGFNYAQGGWDPGWELYRAKFNLDALDDLFLISRVTGRWFRVMGQNGSDFSYPVSGTWYPDWQLYPGDFNNDGLTDLLLHDPPTGVNFVAQSTGAGFDYTQGGWSLGWQPYVADLDGDGNDDVFLHAPDTGVWFELVSDGAGNFTTVGGQTWSLGWDLYPTDLNGDARTDIVLYHPATGVWYQASNLVNGSFTYYSGTWSAGLTMVTRPPIR